MGNYQVGDLIETKKKHPCGCSTWVVIRTGADYKIKCQSCGRIVMLSYEKFIKCIKKVIKQNGESIE